MAAATPKAAAKPKAVAKPKATANPKATAKPRAPVPAPVAPRFHRFGLPREGPGIRYWLMKTEPDVFSFDDLMRAKGRMTCWDGVRNFQARNFMRDHMRVDDLVFIYHSSAEPPGVAGIARVVREAYPDHTAFDPSHAHFDAGSDPASPTWVMVDVRAERAIGPVSLGALRGASGLAQMEVLQPGSRLSITPVSAEEWAGVLQLAERAS